MKKILVIAPHGDDEVLGCGGYMLDQIKRGAEVHVLFATMGGVDVRQPLDKRLAEVECVARATGYKYDIIIIEGAGSPVIQNDGVETTESMQTSEEETDSISEYFTNEQLEHIRQALGIPDDLPVEIEIGDPYYWEGGDMDLIQIDFYHEGDYVAGAAFKPYTEEMARNIYQYSE